MLRRALLIPLLALAGASPASAHVDGPAQLPLEWPASGTLTTPFGWTEGRYHPGLDIGILRSPAVRAAAPGRVRAVGTPAGFDGYGNVVVVDVLGPFETLYAHLASATVQPGALVAAGEELGIAGCTGWCTGTHLHFELRRGATALDPLPLLP
jgi:murein DD-endopeptidase MepM/ murein hydrolase activator NlpD